MKFKISPHIAIIFLGVIIISASFVDTGLFFNSEFQSFSAWFSLSLFSFSCGWLIDKLFGWKKGGKLVFAVTVSAAIINIFLLSFFEVYFSTKSILFEDLILFTLRSFMLGAFGFFGMTLAEYFIVSEKMEKCITIREDYEKMIRNSEKEAELILKESKLKAEKMVFEAEKKANYLITKKLEAETRLRELILVEKEIIKKYESEN